MGDFEFTMNDYDLKSIISKGQLIKAIDKLEEQLRFCDNTELYDTVISTKSRIIRISREFLQGTVSIERKMIEENKITEFLLKHILPKIKAVFKIEPKEFEEFVNSNPNAEKVHIFFQKHPKLINRLLVGGGSSISESWYPSEKLDYSYMRQCYGSSLSTLYFEYIMFRDANEDLRSEKIKEELKKLINNYNSQQFLMRSSLRNIETRDKRDYLVPMDNFSVVFRGKIISGRRENLEEGGKILLNSIAKENQYELTIRTYDFLIDRIREY